MALRNRQTVLFLPMRVWDLPTRLFHWLIVVLVAGLYVSRKLHEMPLHMLLGYAMLALLLFRLVWGFAGSDTARFRCFLVSPLAGLRHLARWRVREPDTQVGHNAAGGWMVLLLLLLLAVQVGSGLCAHDREHNAGPLAKYAGDVWGERLSLVHSVNFNIILAAIALHILAVASYAVFKRQNLIRPMITGKKRLPAVTRAPRMASPLLALLVLAAAAAVAWAVATQV
jgi:cytochrome b